MSGESLLGYAEVMAELRRLCTERRTGIMFIVTATNQSGRILLRDGAIVAVQFQLKRGVDAAREITKMGSARATFTEQDVDAADPQAALPPTSELLKLLAGDAGAAPVAPAASASSKLDDAQVARAQNLISSVLAEFVGPMASVVVREQLQEARRNGHDLRKTVEAIAKKIPDAAKAALFKEQVLARLG